MENDRRKLKITAAMAAALLLIFVLGAYFGAGTQAERGRDIVFLGYGGVALSERLTAVFSFCAFDVVTLASVALLSHPIASSAAAAIVMALRGAAAGCTLAFATGNTVSLSCAVYIVSFFLVSVMMLAYFTLINRNNFKPAAATLIYLLVSGTAVLLRGLPMLVL